MRVSTAMAFEMGTSAIMRQQAETLHTQMQMSSGKRVMSAADDPGAAAHAVEVGSAAQRVQRLIANQDAVRNGLSGVEAVLGRFADELENIRALMIQAGNGVNSDLERSNIAADLEQRGQYLLALANSRDASGAYMFAGFQEQLPAFVAGPGGVLFQGDTGLREVQVGDSRRLPVNASGAAIFEHVLSGNGVFTTAGLAGNSGSGVIDGGHVIDASQLDGHGYDINFRAAPSGLVYDLVDSTSGSTISSGTAYSVSATLNVAGMQLQVDGAPLAGDVFKIRPAASKSVFNTIADAVLLLRRAAPTAASKAQLLMGMASATAGIDRSLDSATLARGAAGAGLRELDALRALADGQGLQYAVELSDLLDVDYARAASDLARQQTVGQATQKVFANTMNRSLFDLI